MGMVKAKKQCTYRERYYKFIAFVLKSQPQNPEAITPEIISGVIGCSVNYAYVLEAERVRDRWGNIKGNL